MRHVALSLMFLLPIAVAAQAPMPKALEPLQGHWSLVTAGGQSVPPGMSAVRFTGDKYEGLTSGKVDERGTIKLDTSTKPMSFEFVITEGEFAGKTQLGLLDIDGDTLTIYIGDPGSKTRPTTSDASNKLILKRLK